ncbi:hypothetical protein OSB04_009955 [Centaurea solstitialis]|uniref:Glycosyltransferase N-terminal domain-containing protein n=1 Tax=Centaurea solstitialis TaxID=347529 RepID=A0AA38THG1_9ASTR|nr:hypothetical protein OSB04_009955 [Centaurea solstitialis]
MADDLHFVIFPLMAQGHMIPMVDIARILAHRGATVTIVTTPVTAARFRPSLSRTKLDIKLLELPLPLAEVGLPEGSEDFDRIPSQEVKVKIFTALDLYEKPAEDLLRRLSPPPACIISDSIFHWTTNTARRLNIPRLVMLLALMPTIAVQDNVMDRMGSVSDRFVLSGLPDSLEFTKFKISGTAEAIPADEKLVRHRCREAEKGAHGIVVHSFEELEPEYVNEFAKAKSKKVWCVGPVSLCNKDSKDITDRGNKGAITEHDCLKWLDDREAGSVVYVGLGSLTRMSTEQAIEVALGLESTNQPFIWCIRTETEELKKWFSEQRFEERVSDRGLIVHGWAATIADTFAPAVGGFRNACGWNSILESVSAGVPMITWPHFADQFLNEMFVVEIRKIGVRVCDVESEIGLMVTKDDVRIAVECLMDDGEEGKARRKRVGELAEMAKKAMEEGGSSYLNVSSLIEDVRDWDRKNGNSEVVPAAV